MKLTKRSDIIKIISCDVKGNFSDMIKRMDRIQIKLYQYHMIQTIIYKVKIKGI